MADATTLTFLFTDIVDSTRLWEESPGQMASALAEHDTLVREVIGLHAGEIFATTGDGFAAAFERASDSARAGIDIQRKVRESTGLPLKVRIGLHTGEAETRGGDFFGQPVNRAARIMNLAHGGQILVSETAKSLLGSNLPEGVSLVELGLHHLRGLSEPVRLYQIAHPDLDDDFPLLRRGLAMSGNLPAETSSLVGRRHELIELIALARRSRLVTVTGPGGTGKTRLALQVATHLRREHPDGVWMTDLSSLRDPDQVPQAVAESLGITLSSGLSASAAVTSMVRGKHMLLLIDNFEQVVEAARFITSLLEAARQLRIIATSREPLMLAGEQVYPLAPLSLLTTSQTGHISEAVLLFVERAREANPHLILDESSMRRIEEICRQLDGLPLAIELASTRARGFTLDQIHRQLAGDVMALSGFRRDQPRRQRTLSDTITWSYQLLEPEHRDLFDHLGVFAGGATLEAVERIWRPEEGTDLLRSLHSLVEKSLVEVRPGPDDEPRYTMLRTIHEFAERRLADLPEEAEVRRRHAEHCTELLEAVEPHLLEDQAVAFTRLKAEMPGVVAALSWAFGGGDPVVGCRILGAGHLYWLFERFDVAEPFQAPALAHLDELTPKQRALVELSTAFLCFGRGDLEGTREHASAAIELFEKLDDTYRLTLAKIGLGVSMIGDPEHYEAAVELAEQALETAESIHAEGLASTINSLLGEFHRTAGHDGPAEEAYCRAVELGRAKDFPFFEASNLINLSYIAHHRGDDRRAEELAASALELGLASGNRLVAAWAVLGLAGPSLTTRGAETTARLLGAGDAALETLGVARQPGDEPEYQGVKVAAGAVLGTEAVTELIADGRELTIEDVARYATGADRSE